MDVNFKVHTTCTFRQRSLLLTLLASSRSCGPLLSLLVLALSAALSAMMTICMMFSHYCMLLLIGKTTECPKLGNRFLSCVFPTVDCICLAAFCGLLPIRKDAHKRDKSRLYGIMTRCSSSPDSVVVDGNLAVRCFLYLLRHTVFVSAMSHRLMILPKVLLLPSAIVLVGAAAVGSLRFGHSQQQV